MNGGETGRNAAQTAEPKWMCAMETGAEEHSAPTARTRLLLGDAACAALGACLVTVAGLGGVGGHCTEALARAGVGRLHIVDFDTVAPSNLNRQLIATKRTLGMKKTVVMSERIMDVSDCRVTAYDGRIGADTVDEAMRPDADFIVDCIDSVPGKTALALYAHAHGIPMVSCMGAGNRLDPMQFFVTDLFDTKGDPLARCMRHALRQAGLTALPVICSRETAHVAPGQRVIGSLAPVTAAAGLCAAGYVIGRLTARHAPAPQDSAR